MDTRDDVKSDMAVLSLGVRGSERRENASDLGIGVDKGCVEKVVYELALRDG